MHPAELQTAHTDTCKTHVPYQNCTYNRLHEDESSGSNDLEDIKIKLKY